MENTDKCVHRVAYNRNQEQETDSFWACVAVRNLNANPPGLNAPDTYPPCQILFETPQINNRHPRVEVALQGPVNWHVPTAMLYHPEGIPVLNPPLPPTFDFNIETVRRIIVLFRRP
jgi:hypothetical protein